MVKKYILAGAIGAFLAAANVAHAPIQDMSYNPSIEKSVLIESIFGEDTKENKEKEKKLMKKFDDLAHYRTDSFYDDDLQILVARLMLGETEDYSKIDKIAVAWTAMNRAKKYNSSLRTEILRPYQFSCFNEGSDSSIFLKVPLEHNERDFIIDLQLSKEFLEGKYKDPTYGATFYYNPRGVHGTPDWVKHTKFSRRIGDHLFYKER